MLCLLSAGFAAETENKLILKPSLPSPEVFERIDFEVVGVPSVTSLKTTRTTKNTRPDDGGKICPFL
jgi:hypothetical protein